MIEKKWNGMEWFGGLGKLKKLKKIEWLKWVPQTRDYFINFFNTCHIIIGEYLSHF